MDQPSEAEKQLLLNLRRVEGQVRSLQGQIQEGKGTVEVLTQMAAATGALQSAARRFFVSRTEELDQESLQQAIDRLLKV